MDVANLVQSTKAFLSIPPSTFRQLLARGYPWIWETWCSLPFSFWLIKTESEVMQHFKDRAESMIRFEGWIQPVLEDERQQYESGALEPVTAALSSQFSAAEQEHSDFQQLLPTFSAIEGASELAFSVHPDHEKPRQAEGAAKPGKDLGRLQITF
ncbi:hypothetical protein EDB81DRAFT_888178 [Dactylonectria macrodidyma]|uniref:Uncharacterized protein n=1 Tax=Dactylonectria macrodidyma TaxID=307937 RepID=A0A9P9E579_9HYPO|nr:hypothetical protein EDB81DRAFT_888178 [Dactylonectria macrodidyma]